MFRPFRAGLVWGRCSQGVALGYLLWPRCGQRRPRWRTPPSCRVAANTGLVGATSPSCHVAANAGLVGATPPSCRVAANAGPVVHLLRLAAFGHVSSYQRLHNDRPYPRAPTGRHAIARGNALGIAPPNQSSPERARFHTAILYPNPRTPPPRQRASLRAGQKRSSFPGWPHARARRRRGLFLPAEIRAGSREAHRAARKHAARRSALPFLASRVPARGVRANQGSD